MSTERSVYELRIDQAASEADLDRLIQKAQKLQDILSENRVGEEKREKAEKEAYEKKQRTAGRAAGGMMMGAGAMAAGYGAMSGSYAALFGGIGVATKGLGAFIQNLDGAGKTVGKIGKAFGILGAGIAASGIVSQMHYQMALQRVGYEKATTFSTLGGAGISNEKLANNSGVEFAPKLGMGPAEWAAQVTAHSQAAGFRRSALSNDDLSMYMRTGISSGGIGNLSGTLAAARDGGSAQVATKRIIAAGFREGLHGSRLEKYMGTVAGAVDQAEAAGVRTQATDLANLISNMSDEIKRSGGSARMVGARTGAALAGLPVSAKQQMLAPFQQAAQSLVMARAFSKGGGFWGGVSELESMGAGGSLAALQDMPFVGKGFLAQTMPVGMTDAAMRATSKKGRTSFGRDLPEASKLVQAKTRMDAHVMATMSQADAIGMVSAMGALQIELRKATKSWATSSADLVQIAKDVLDLF